MKAWVSGGVGSVDWSRTIEDWQAQGGEVYELVELVQRELAHAPIAQAEAEAIHYQGYEDGYEDGLVDGAVEERQRFETKIEKARLEKVKH